jgi:hypothetical protein
VTTTRLADVLVDLADAAGSYVWADSTMPRPSVDAADVPS